MLLLISWIFKPPFLCTVINPLGSDLKDSLKNIELQKRRLESDLQKVKAHLASEEHIQSMKDKEIAELKQNLRALKVKLCFAHL